MEVTISTISLWLSKYFSEKESVQRYLHANFAGMGA
jgi:hypothetical protein